MRSLAILTHTSEEITFQGAEEFQLFAERVLNMLFANEISFSLKWPSISWKFAKVLFKQFLISSPSMNVLV